MGAWVVKTEKDYMSAFDAIQKKLNSITEGVESATAQEVADILLDCAQRSSDRAPKDTADLRGSVYVAVDGEVIREPRPYQGPDENFYQDYPIYDPEPGTVTGEVSFTAKYAATQHEHLEFNHTDGEAKFLEKTVDENLEEWKRQLRAAAIRAIRGEDT